MTFRRVRQSSSTSARGTAGHAEPPSQLFPLPHCSKATRAPKQAQNLLHADSHLLNPLERIPPAKPHTASLPRATPQLAVPGHLRLSGTHPASPGSRGRAAPSFPRCSWRRWWRCCGWWRRRWWRWWQLLRVPAATEERITSRPQPAEVGAQMFPARIGPAGADVARLLGALLGALLGDGDALSITGATRGRGEGGREGEREGGRRKRGGGRSRSRHRDAPRRAVPCRAAG